MRNWIVFNDPLALKAWLITWGADAIRGGEVSPDIALLRIPYAYQSLWARFGQGAVSVGSEVYLFFNAVVAVAISGIVLRLARLINQLRQKLYPSQLVFRQGVLVTIFTLSWAGALFSLSSSGWSANQGRYLLTGVAGWSALIALGLTAWFPRRVFKPAVVVSTVALGAVAIICLFVYELPSYQINPVPAKIDLGLSYTYENYAELIGMSPAYPRVQPGETFTLTLYWRALKPTPTRFQVYLHTTGTQIVRRDSDPATGNLLSTDWQSGDQWAENYRIVIPDDAPPQTVDTLIAGLYNPDTGHNLIATNADGKQVTPIIGAFAVNGPQLASSPIAYRFGDTIALGTPQVKLDGQQLQVCLIWQALQDQTTDYNLFVHIFAADGKMVDGQDSLLGDKYPNSAWRTGEIVNDCVEMKLTNQPTSESKLSLGLYTLPALSRLSVTDAQSAPLPNSEIIIPFNETTS
ncbi:MAG: hypothetical protein H0X30_39160 [Anaerolineae bacterium]|nr:hypothetical protein [Anaerolineae bacterium]